MKQICIIGDVNAEGTMLKVHTFSRIDLNVINRRGASLLVVPLKSAPLFRRVFDSSGFPRACFPQLKGVNTLAELLPLAFPSQFTAWKQQQVEQEPTTTSTTTTSQAQPSPKDEPDQVAKPVKKTRRRRGRKGG